jgi:hypothetical protein
VSEMDPHRIGGVVSWILRWLLRRHDVPRWVAVTCSPPEAADFHDVSGQGYIWIDSVTGENAGAWEARTGKRAAESEES